MIKKSVGAIELNIVNKRSRGQLSVPEYNLNGDWLWWDEHGYKISKPKVACECESMGCCSESISHIECCNWETDCCVWENDSFKCKPCPQSEE